MTAKVATGGKASLIMVGLLRGDTGCPNHPITLTQTDDTFTLFGAGFTPGAVTIHLDTATGASLGTATAKADGSFCQVLPGVPGSQAGARKLVAVQDGATQAQLAITFVLPSVVR